MAEEDATEAGGIETVDGETRHDRVRGPHVHPRPLLRDRSATDVFLANVEGPWIHPDAMDAEKLVAVAEACPSGAIRYRRSDGRPGEAPPPVNLLAVREAGPYAVHGES